MPEFTEQILEREIRISQYDDESFASATLLRRVQVLRDGQPIGPPEWVKEPLTDQAALQALLGEAAAGQRAHVAEVESRMLALRAQHQDETAALRARIAELEAAAA